ncbi:hypothetical protein NMY22_g6650 [Coprinellus aureogranulatus]|nr:hypothetical protein NMY22_g6650 [Coprinellus aureogranulatus]
MASDHSLSDNAAGEGGLALTAGGNMVSHPVGSPIISFHYNMNEKGKPLTQPEFDSSDSTDTRFNLRPPQVQSPGFIRAILGRFLGFMSNPVDVNPSMSCDHSSTQLGELSEKVRSYPCEDASDGQTDFSLASFGGATVSQPASPRPVMSKAEAYVSSMLLSGEGLACWKPRPRYPIKDGEGIVPGDVGKYSPEGSFKKIFNIWDDKDSIQTTALTLGTSYEISPKEDNCLNDDEHLEGDTVVRGTTAKTFYHSDSQVITGFEFRHLQSHQTGAVLAITSPATLEELNDSERTMLQEHISRYAELFYRYANQRSQIQADEGLYIVTACTKSENWALAGFCVAP